MSHDPQMAQMLHTERKAAAAVLVLSILAGCAWCFLYVKPANAAMLAQVDCASVAQAGNERITAEEAWAECGAAR